MKPGKGILEPAVKGQPIWSCVRFGASGVSALLDGLVCDAAAGGFFSLPIDDEAAVVISAWIRSSSCDCLPIRLLIPLSKAEATMATLLIFHEVDDVDHWLSSPRRQELFGPIGMTVRTFVDPRKTNRVG